ncbi:inositol 2-dehydrogenase [Candidatus Poribacteria bacterium]|nr:inositol 2-dehydrogenase [Candidatus Poribacteria bacterium]
MKDSSKVGVGVIGTGRIGTVHIKHLCQNIPNAEVLSICSLDTKIAKTLSERYYIPQITTHFNQLLDNSEIDAVVVASSTDTHIEICQAAANARKHIFCEKPIALELKAIDDTLSVVKESGVKLQVGFNRRFDVNFLRLQELIRKGEIGVPHILRITSRDPSPPPIEYLKVSGGIFLDMTIHDFDMARFLIGDEIDEIYAVGNVNIDPEIGQVGDFDTAVITLRFKNGILGTIDNSRQAVYGYDQRVEVFGSKGMVSVGNSVPDTITSTLKNGSITSLPQHFFIERYKQAYLLEMESFIQSIIVDTKPKVTGKDGKIPIQIGYAALKSIEENRPVSLSEIQ